ncbi:hypothetical protein LSCM1_01788 [Leishmania martiniquensis]|uniref:Uncharacterized protein n=1 Tax=Leishmania martiniquensis TaxID=1580590 RepID=A0A836GEA1_9TRYP|nr:hypothetical protein LSCM1_01788 [Leishmania martiniquensis]
MLKGIKKGISHMDLRHSHKWKSKKGSGADSEEAENGSETPTMSMAQTNVSVPLPEMMVVGPKSMPLPGGGPPGIAGGPLPPGMVMKGVLPPGVKIIKSPPANVVMKVIAGGSGPVNLTERGYISPTQGGSPSPSPGMKVIGQPPPGAKIIIGMPPQLMKTIPGAVPPGLKIMHSAPPPSAPRAASPPLSSTPQTLSRANTPPLVQGMAARAPMKIPPPGAKLISCQPQPGSSSMSPEGTREGAANASLTPSRSVSPTNLPVFRILPNGVKVLVTPPPTGAPVKILSNMLPVCKSPSPPMKSPPMLFVKSMADVTNAGGAPTVSTPRTTAPLIPPQNGSSFLGPKSLAAPQQQLPRPTPVRPGGTIVKADEATVRVRPGQSQQAPTALYKSAPQLAAQQSQSDELNFQEEDTAGDASVDEIQFEEAAPLIPPQTPRADAAAEHLPRTSLSSSLSLHEDPDAATALPPVATTHTTAAPLAMPSPRSSSAAVGATALAGSEQSSQQHRSEDSSQGARKKKRKAHRAPQGSDGVNDGRPSRRESRKHRRHHHRSHSKETGVISRRSASQQSYSVSDAQVSASPVAVDNTQRRTPSELGGLSNKRDQVDAPEQLGGGKLRDAAFTPQTLTSTTRDRIAEHFLSMLCPQQYYGKVQKISRIRPFKADCSAATGLRRSSSIYVATKGVMPNPYFYPQLRLRSADGEMPTSLARGEGMAKGVVSTPIILYEAAPGNMLFADTELEARRLLERNRNATSCFILSLSAILFRDPEHYVLPIASLNVEWVPYASPQSEPQCPIHKRELQLFDRCSKELVCALCASRNGISMANFVVVPDVLGNPDSRRTIEEKVSLQLDEAQHSARRWVEQHQRVRELCESKKEAISSQFDLLIEALEAKRKEYLEACEAEFAYAQTNVAREILITDEKVQLLRAATEHLRTDPSKPLFSMQIATIAEGLSASTDLPSRFTRASLQLPPMSTGLVPNLEGIMSQVLQLGPQLPLSGSAGGESRSLGRALTNSPYSTRPNSARCQSRQPMEESVNIANRDRWRSSRTGKIAAAAPGKSPWPATGNADTFPQCENGRSSAPCSPPRRIHSGPSAMREEASIISATSQRKSGARAASSTPFAADAVSVPNSTGTSLFDFALHDLLSTLGTPNMKRRSPRYVQWAIRVEDPGDWVGLGVGVGNTIDAWEQGSTNDLSHLWIVPHSFSAQVLYLRVAVNASSGHAKLTVHDARGKQLDAGEVPQWNAARPAYPQATFGGHIGTVRMIEIPHIVR